MKKKEQKDLVSDWKIELTEKQLRLISEAIEFTSRFSCGQIGHTYLPSDLQEMFYVKDKDNQYNWDEINKRKDLFQAAGNIMKTALYPELNPTDQSSYGVNKSDYADNLYDIYKMINHKLHEYNQMNTSPDERNFNVNSSFTKFGDLPNIKVNKSDD